MKFPGYARFRAALFIAALWLFTLALSHAEVRQDSLWWLPHCYTTTGDQIDYLFYIIFWLTAAVFVAVTYAQIYFMVKYRARKGVKAVYSHGNNTLEIVWTTIPSVIFIGLVAYSNHMWNDFFDRKLIPADVMTIEITAEQYGWNIRYPGPDGVLGKASDKMMDDNNKLGLDTTDPAGKDDFIVYNEMAIPKGRPIKLLLRSRDVIHAFYVPEFRLYQDIIPGRTIDWVWFQTTDTAHLQIACNQLCGAGHYNMKAKLTIMDPADFTKWEIAHEQKTAALPAAPAPVLTAQVANSPVR